MPSAIVSTALRRNLNFLLPGLGAAALVAGLLLASNAGERQGAVYAVLGVSVALFGAAIGQALVRRAAAARAGETRPADMANRKSAAVPDVSFAAPAAPLPAVAAPATPEQAPLQSPNAAATPAGAAPQRVAEPFIAPHRARAPQSKDPPDHADSGPMHAAPTGNPPGDAPTNSQVLLDSTLGDLLVAALLKNPLAVDRLRALLADESEPNDLSREDECAGGPGSAA